MLQEKRRAILSLVLLVPLASVGTLSALVLWPGTGLGGGIFAAAKALLIILPVVWHRYVDGDPIKISRPSWRPLLWGAATGVVIAVAIALAYAFLGPYLIDRERMRAAVSGTGLGSRGVFLAGALYWTFVNALIEEYVWRWFVAERFARLVGRSGAVVASAAAFTLHHVIALAVYMPAPSAALCSLGVAVGGATWSLLYVKYRSVWPCYVSHVLADAAIFAAGYALVFG